MEDKIDFKTLLNFSSGNYSYNEYLKVKDWFVHVRDDEQTESQLFKYWMEKKDVPDDANLHSIFEKIHYQILLEEKNLQQKRSFWNYYRQVAAFLIPLIVLSALVYFFLWGKPQTQSWVEINAPEGARIEFMLPDSSFGWLNSGAKLKYPAVFNSHRKVKLSGEAFFNVKHLAHSDFTVSVADMDIKVLGTRFNVSAYPDESVTEVVLNEGKVEINGKTGRFSKTLCPGEKIAYDHETKQVDVNKVDPALYSAWKDGYLIIDNETLEQVVKKLGRWYNAEISIQDDILKNFRFKATFADEPLDEVLQLIAMTTPITYKIEKRNIDSNGIIKKKQIKIMLKQ